MRKTNITELFENFVIENSHKKNQEILDEFYKKYGIKYGLTQLYKYKKKHGLLNYSLKNINDQDNFIIENYDKMTWQELIDTLNKKYNTNHSVSKILWAKRRKNLEKNKKHKIGDEVIINNTIYVKTINGDYKPKSRIIYEKHKGKIPENYVVIHMDKNLLNNNIENLQIIKKKDMTYLSIKGLYFKSKELNNISITINELHNKVIKKKKEVF